MNPGRSSDPPIEYTYTFSVSQERAALHVQNAALTRANHIPPLPLSIDL